MCRALCCGCGGANCGIFSAAVTQRVTSGIRKPAPSLRRQPPRGDRTEDARRRPHAGESPVAKKIATASKSGADTATSMSLSKPASPLATDPNKYSFRAPHARSSGSIDRRASMTPRLSGTVWNELTRSHSSGCVPASHAIRRRCATNSRLFRGLGGSRHRSPWNVRGWKHSSAATNGGGSSNMAGRVAFPMLTIIRRCW